MKINMCIRFAMAAIIVALGTTGAFAQLTSGAQSISLSATVNESLTVSPAVGSYNFGTVTPGSAINGPGTTVAITTDYRLNNTRTNVRLCAYFGAAATAMTGAVDNIPSSAIEVRGGTLLPTFAQVNGTCAAGFGVAGASRTLANYAVAPGTRRATQVESFEFNLNLSALPNLNADTYGGTLNVQAQATP
jgi:hypothetical protein